MGALFFVHRYLEGPGNVYSTASITQISHHYTTQLAMTSKPRRHKQPRPLASLRRSRKELRLSCKGSKDFRPQNWDFSDQNNTRWLLWISQPVPKNYIHQSMWESHGKSFARKVLFFAHNELSHPLVKLQMLHVSRFPPPDLPEDKP